MKFLSASLLTFFLCLSDFSAAQMTISNGDIVYFIRLSDEKTAENKTENQDIIEAFEKEFTARHYYFFYAKDVSKILAGEYESVVFDANRQRKSPAKATFKTYLINFGFGYPKDGQERYNYKGFSLHEIENNKLVNTGIYGGAPYQFLGLGKKRDYQKAVQQLLKKMFKK